MRWWLFWALSALLLVSATCARAQNCVGGTSIGSGSCQALAASVAATTYAPLASPTFTGTVTIPTGASIAGYETTSAAASLAPLASPTFTGTVTAPTLALTGSEPASYVHAAPSGAAGAPTWRQLAAADITGVAPLASPTFTGTVTIPSGASISGFAKLASPTFTGTMTVTNLSGGTPAALTVGTCGGSGASSSGNAARGFILTGSTATTSCTVTLPGGGSAYPNGPFCLANTINGSIAMGTNSTTGNSAAVTFTFGSSVTNQYFMYHCWS